MVTVRLPLVLGGVVLSWMSVDSNPCVRVYQPWTQITHTECGNLLGARQQSCEDAR